MNWGARWRVVALMLRNEPVVLELMLATRWIGARWCMINTHLKSDEVSHILRDSGAKVLVVHADLVDRIRDGIPASVPVFVVLPLQATREAHGLDDGCAQRTQGIPRWASFRDSAERPAVEQNAPGPAMVYTSGTTGRPKGIRRATPSAEQVQRIMEASRAVFGIAPGVRGLISAPLYHSAPASYLLQMALHDCHVVIEPRFDAQRTLQLIESERISHLYLVPTMLVRLLRLPPDVRSRYRLDSVKFVVCTGSPCAPEIKRRMIEWWGPVIHETYAASELGFVTHITSGEALQKPGSVGRPLAGVQLRVMSSDGQELSPGCLGIIYARHEAVADFTYNNNDEARRRLERNGLWTLGDMGYLDEDGYLFIVDRQSDMVISGGVNIYPAEIEAILITMPGVADCAVFGVPDDEFGEALMAAVQTVDAVHLTPEDVRAFVRERIADYKVPRLVVFHPQLPREDTGKIFKRKLREQYKVAGN